jgi:hypothetical protein
MGRKIANSTLSATWLLTNRGSRAGRRIRGIAHSCALRRFRRVLPPNCRSRRARWPGSRGLPDADGNPVPRAPGDCDSLALRRAARSLLALPSCNDCPRGPPIVANSNEPGREGSKDDMCRGAAGGAPVSQFCAISERANSPSLTPSQERYQINAQSARTKGAVARWASLPSNPSTLAPDSVKPNPTIRPIDPSAASLLRPAAAESRRTERWFRSGSL